MSPDNFSVMVLTGLARLVLAEPGVVPDFRCQRNKYHSLTIIRRFDDLVNTANADLEF